MLALAIQKCDQKKVDLSKLLDTSSSESDENGTVEGLTDENMREAQEELAKLVSAEQVQHAMIILNGFRVGATKEQNRAAVVSFKAHQIQADKTINNFN